MSEHPVVRGNFACDFANIFLNLVNDVNLVWLRRQFLAARGTSRPAFQVFGRNRGAVALVFCWRPEAAAMTVIVMVSFHLIVLNRAKIMLAFFVRGLLYDRRGSCTSCSVSWRSGNIDENALRALDDCPPSAAGDSAIAASRRRGSCSGHGGAHHSVALAMHNRFYIAKSRLMMPGR